MSDLKENDIVRELEYPVELVQVIDQKLIGGLVIQRSMIHVPNHGHGESELAFCKTTKFYLGDPEFAKKLQNKFQIDEFFKAHPSQKIATVGHSKAQSMFYGWSMTKICGFRIGDMIFDANFEDDKAPFEKHGTEKIKNREDCIQSAINFSLWANIPVKH